MRSSTCSGSGTLSGVGFRSSLRKLDPLGILAIAGRLVVDAFGVDARESEDERGCMLRLGGSGPGPVLLMAGEYGLECGGVDAGVD
jgi:hypothetical protein